MLADLRRRTIDGDEAFLRQTSSPVDFRNDDYWDYVAALRQYCRARAVFALAPIQIGLRKRLVYIKNTSPDMTKNTVADYDEGIVYINPTITAAKGQTTFLEGCDSCSVVRAGQTIYYVGVVDRPYEIEITYYDLQGQMQSQTLSGFVATVFCHEYDHLNGILHLDKAQDIREMTLSEMQDYRRAHPYTVLSEDSPTAWPI